VPLLIIELFISWLLRSGRPTPAAVDGMARR